MLIEFRVRNFRSIRDEQVLSMVANDDTELLDSNTIETGITTTPRLVRSAAIYGANASGKSNLIKAMIWMQGFIFQSAKVDVNQLILNDPFLFDGQSKDQPTLFEISFMLEGVHYQYGIEVTRERVITEYLFDFKQPEPHSWFEREYDSETGTYDFVSDLGRGETEKVWRESTKPNSLFLAVAVQLNSTELKPIYDFFFNRLKIARNALAVNNMVFAQYLEIPETKAEITDFLHRAGIVFEEIQTKRHKGVQNSFLVDQVAKTVEMTESEAEFFEIGFVHKAGDGTVKIDLSQESEGTIKIFAMAGPILEFLKSGNVFIVDELELSPSHPFSRVARHAV